MLEGKTEEAAIHLRSLRSSPHQETVLRLSLLCDEPNSTAEKATRTWLLSCLNDCSEETRMAFGIIHQNADPDLEMRRANSAAQTCVVAGFAGYRHLRNNQPEEAAKWFKTASEQGLPDRVETRFALIKLDRG